MEGTREGPRILLLGAPPDTGNMGVTALCHSAIEFILSRFEDPEIFVVDYGTGIREDRYRRPGGDYVYSRIGWKLTRKIHRPDSYFRVRWSRRLGGLGNPVLRLLESLDLAMDVSGGDSFTDLYGSFRFESVVQPKEFLLRIGIPLVLLPQTYGPFREEKNRNRASSVVKGARECWARDPYSFEILKNLAGSETPEERLRNGEDLAFRLPPLEPLAPLPENLASWIEEGNPRIHGLNISGLIYNDPETAESRFRLRSNYHALVHRLIEKILERSDRRLVLVPHVLTPPGHYESDEGACLEALENLGLQGDPRVACLPRTYSPGELKWIISHFTWFCGTRMHSTIAALSSGVRTFALAYSDKTKGVFRTKNSEETCYDLRDSIDPDALPELLEVD